MEPKRPGPPEPCCEPIKKCKLSKLKPCCRDAASPEHRSMQSERADSPAPSCVSINSGQSIELPVFFKGVDTSEHRSHVRRRRSSFDGKKPTLHKCSLVQAERSNSPVLSCVSISSDQSMELPVSFGKEDKNTSEHRSMQSERADSPAPSCVSVNSGQSIELPVFKSEHRSHARRQCQSCDGIKPALRECSADCQHAEVHNKLISDLWTMFHCLCEGTEKQGNPTLLSEIYTELYITEGGGGEINDEHEVRRIEKASRKAATEDIPINLNDIFTPLLGQKQPIRTVLTKGVAGIGKTVSVQKFILDWAEGKTNQDIHLIFPLSFRELNLLKNQTFNLQDLLQLFMGTKQLEFSPDEGKTIFIFDGLDECRLSLDFQRNVRLCDVTESASVDVLLTNFAGNLLPSALIWITSRPAAADLIPYECVHRLTEVRGFNDPQKEEYFRKRFKDQSLANRIISHLKSSRSLYIMCHIPVFCWISATVLEKMLSQAESGEIPETLTQMYTHFLIIQMRTMHEKAFKMKVKDEDMILKLGKLAFRHLMKGNAIFYEEDLRECDIDVTEASVYSGLCTQIFREAFGLCQRRVYCFVHLSIQEHLAAVYVMFSFNLKNLDILSEYQSLKHNVQYPTCFTIYERAVEAALQSKNGHLDLFLRFLLGLSLESNQTLFQCLLTQTGATSHNTEQIIQYVKRKIREDLSPEKSINLFHCLNELSDHTLENEIQDYLNAGTIKDAILSPSQWSALVFVLLTLEKMEVFELNKYIRDEFNQKHLTQDQVLHNLLPVVELSRSAQLGCCSLSENCCADLASALSSESSCLREVNLNFNNLQSSGVKLLSAGLGNPHCKLETLWLWRCGLTHESCAALASALNSNPSHLRELDLSENNLGDQGVKLFSDSLKNPQCKLETLKLRYCNLSDKSCAALASALTSALRSNPSHLRELDLSENELGDDGVNFLSDGLKNPLCKLEILWLRDCDITDEGCAALDSALRSNPSHLRELDLTTNNVRDLGAKWLSVALQNPECQLKILRLKECGVTDESCASLASALRSNPSHLKVLDLSENRLGDSGIKLLSKGPKCPAIGLEQLWLTGCGITHKGCDALASALTSNLSQLKELNLSNNVIGDSGLKLFSDALQSPHCKLQTLGLNDCGITDEGCDALISALTLNLSNLSKLHLSGNEIEKSTIERLLALKDHPDNKLEKVNLSTCRSESLLSIEY